MKLTVTEMTYRISVVVPTFKRPDLLHQCLGALTTQDLVPSEYEVIVVDDAASAVTQWQVEQWNECMRRGKCENCPVHTIRYIAVTGSHGPSVARNVGWRAARGEIIAFTDDDCLPTPGWLRAGLSVFSGEVVGATGKLVMPLAHIPTDYERNATRLEKSEFITANCFYRRAMLEQVGGFDERFTAAWREDSDLFFTLRKYVEKNGCRNLELLSAFVYAPRAVVIHPVRPAPWGISIRQQRKSMFNALLYKKHPVAYRERIQSAPPWHYYCILGALLVAIGSALAGFWLFALVAFTVWMFLTGRFCLLRLQGTSHTPVHVMEMIVTSIVIPLLSIFWRIVGAVRFRVFFL